MDQEHQINLEVEAPEEFARRVGLNFTNLNLLSRALTHRSYVNEHPETLEDNERLEFLGDAILDFLVGEWLYNHFPELAEGELTRLRSALVKTDRLAEFARQINVGAAIRLGRGENEGGGRERIPLLCGTFEALVGAIYINGGIEQVRLFMEPKLQMAIGQILFSHRAQDPKSYLQEWAQSQGFGPPSYRIISTDGPDHDKTFEVEVVVSEKPMGHGSGRSKQAAAKAAARDALEMLDLY